jgi:hypothetical protein
VIGELGVALLVEEASAVEASSPSARFADEGEVVRGEVGEDERAVGVWRPPRVPTPPGMFCLRKHNN